MHKSSETRQVKLSDHPYLDELRDPPFVWQGYPADHIIRVTACEGYLNDWAAYMETPFTLFKDEVNFGNKIPQDVAEAIFPEWAKSKLKWRS